MMIANSSNCLIIPGWLAIIVEDDSIINATIMYTLMLDLARPLTRFACSEHYIESCHILVS